MREGDWKLVQFYDDGRVELYNLKTDTSERHDLSRMFPARTATMLQMLNEWKKESHAKIPSVNPYYNPDYQELMKATGETKNEFLARYDSLFSKKVFDPNLKVRIKEQLARYHQ